MIPEDTIAAILAANRRAAAARRAAVKEAEPPPGRCRELGCTEASLPDQPYCSVHTLIGKVPELGDEQRPKAVERETHPCNRCGAGIPDIRCTSICDECAAPAPSKSAANTDMTCVTCAKDVKGCFPVNGKPTPICFSCWRKTDDGRSKKKDKLKHKQPRQPQIIEENWGGPCRGGCGKYNQGEFYCADCRKKAAEKNFALQPGEVELYRGNIGDVSEKYISQVVAIEASSVKIEPMKWLWQERIPDGAITWVVGQPGNAKSLLTIEVAACASAGRDYPDGAMNAMGPVKVLMFCGEDDLGKTVVPRLMAAGANLDNIRFLDSKSFRETVGDTKIPGRSIDLDKDMETLLGLLKANSDIKLMVADPITGIFGAKQITKDQEVNPILEQLVDLCKETGLVFLGVCHTPKRQTNSATEKIAGGSAVAGKCRAAFMLSHDPDSDDRHAHVMTMIKGNLTGKKSGLKYRTLEHSLTDEIRIAKIEWGEATDDVADDVLAKQNRKPEERDRQIDKCEAFLLTFLAQGPRRSPEVYDAGEKQGFSSPTVKRALKGVAGHHIDRRGKGQGYWMSLEANPVFDEPVETKQVVMGLAAGEAL